MLVGLTLIFQNLIEKHDPDSQIKVTRYWFLYKKLRVG